MIVFTWKKLVPLHSLNELIIIGASNGHSCPTANPAENSTHQPCSAVCNPCILYSHPICFSWLSAAHGKVMTVFLFSRDPWCDLMALGDAVHHVTPCSNQRLDQSVLSIDSVALLTQRWRKKKWDIFHFDFTASALHSGCFHCSGFSLYCQSERTSSWCVRVQLSLTFPFCVFTSALRQSVESIEGWGRAVSFTVFTGLDFLHLYFLSFLVCASLRDDRDDI